MLISYSNTAYSDSDESTALSAGVIAAICIICLLILVAIIAAIMYYFYMERKKRKLAEWEAANRKASQSRNIYVLHNVRIGKIPELSCAK